MMACRHALPPTKAERHAENDMPVQLKDLLNPASTAVLCMEMQRGVVGDLSPISQLVEAARFRPV